MDKKLLDRVKKYIIKFKEGNDGLSPSYRNMARALGQSVGMIQRCIDALVEDGTLKKGPRGGLMIEGGVWEYWGS